MPLNGAHLRMVLGEYVAYYNRSRCHQSPDGNAPEPREAEGGHSPVYVIPHVGGLQHE